MWWKVYWKVMEFKRRNKSLEALDVLKTMGGVITEQMKWFNLVVKCSLMSNQWKEIEHWKIKDVHS
jgi:hypothetical protein